MIWPFKRKKKPVPPPVPWDGVHRLLYVLFEEFFGSTPQDYRTGWVWKCSCGNGTEFGAFPRYSRDEEAAVLSFKIHRNRYVGV